MFQNKHQTKATDSIVTDFKHRAPYGGYRPVDYEDYEPFIRMTSTLDSHLDKLFAGETSIDAGNKDVIDHLIIDMAAKAEQDLNRQQIDHTDKIHSISNRRTGDRLAFERQLEQLQAELADNEHELADIESRYRVNKF